MEIPTTDTPTLTEADVLPTEDGLVDIWGSGHASGPWDEDEIAELDTE
jgi:hypothetical protein